MNPFNEWRQRLESGSDLEEVAESRKERKLDDLPTVSADEVTLVDADQAPPKTTVGEWMREHGEVQQSDGFYVLKLGEQWGDPKNHFEYLHSRWEQLWGGADNAPLLLIIDHSCDLVGPLPGRYAVHEEMGGYKKTVTFQKLSEMEAYLASVPKARTT